ncbi:hypothetical protein NQ314_016994, partial [Rhamnusium bicolor]
MSRIDGDNNAAKKEIATTRRETSGRPPLLINDQTRICFNWNVSILNEITAIENDPTCLRLNVLTQTSSHSCAICDAVENLQKLTIQCRVIVFVTKNIYISECVRVCQQHLDENNMLIGQLMAGLRLNFKISKLPKTSSWIKNVPELERSGDKVFCKSCAKIIVYEEKFQVDQHLKTSIRKAKLQKIKSGPVKQSVKITYQNVGNQIRSETEVFHQDLCKALVAALNKLRNTQFKEFLQKYCNQNIHEEYTIRKKNVHAVYKMVIQEIKVSLDNDSFYIIVDESTDTYGRNIAHLIIGALQKNNP